MLKGVAVGGGGGGRGLVAGVRVGKATGVVYLPRLGFMCSLGGRVLGTQPPLATFVVKRYQTLHHLSSIYLKID